MAPINKNDPTPIPITTSHTGIPGSWTTEPAHPHPGPMPVDPLTYQKVLEYAHLTGDAVRTRGPAIDVEDLLRRALAQVLSVHKGQAPMIVLCDATKDLGASVREVVGQLLPPTPQGIRFLPAKEDLTPAARQLVAGKRKHAAKLLVVQLDEGQMLLWADATDLCNKMAEHHRQQADDYAGMASLFEGGLFLRMQEAGRVLMPILDQHPSLTPDFVDYRGYMTGRGKKGQKTKRAQARKMAEEIEKQAESKVRAEGTPGSAGTIAGGEGTVPPDAGTGDAEPAPPVSGARRTAARDRLFPRRRGRSRRG